MTAWEDWPLGGATIRLAPEWLPRDLADEFLSRTTQEIEWRREELTIFGKRREVPRRVAWQGDPGTAYRYSGTLHVATGWTPAVRELRERLHAELAGTRFNGVLLNLYRDGNDTMGWHADDERELGDEPVIASISLGAVRTFRLRRRGEPRTTFDRPLPHGSLLVMSGATQSNWQHCLPRRARVDAPRVNLTFRELHAHG
ncbi:MAG: alpha-ketoglutarate-dependent dioxygenase AlkB [Planctomycetes bacterium]|nr:alpha-ketoglutarate-dependent dioxygenase AlkB [Planctomycetota bacterium]MCB9902919.1 alpha-ketoglutarate-dependent dioxygenase AlkB [Planctomycetota bacterium]